MLKIEGLKLAPGAVSYTHLCRAEIAHIVQPQQLWEKLRALAHGEMGHDIGLHPLVQRDDGRDSPVSYTHLAHRARRHL